MKKKKLKRYKILTFFWVKYLLIQKNIIVIYLIL